jgi:hypothetical protein
MSCVTSVSYVVLINGEPSSFFQRGKGLRQGCPLSPLLFILVMESLSILIRKEKEAGTLTGIKVSRITKILHLLFVDDVLIMSRASVEEWTVIANILKDFQNATGLQINEDKSNFHSAGMEEEGCCLLKRFFHIDLSPLIQVSIPGFLLKPNCYKVEDWCWLLKKFEKRIDHWCNRWLTLGGVSFDKGCFDESICLLDVIGSCSNLSTRKIETDDLFLSCGRGVRRRKVSTFAIGIA